jgi:hypothetical protein
MSSLQRINWETLRVLAGTSLNGSYVALGTPLVNRGFIIKMVNTGTTDVLVSIDGTTAIDVCPAGSFWLYDEFKSGQGEWLPAKTQFYVNGSVSATGSIYLAVQYLVIPGGAL